MGFAGTAGQVNVCAGNVHCVDSKCELVPTLGDNCSLSCFNSFCDGAICVVRDVEDAACVGPSCELGLTCSETESICVTPDPSTLYVGFSLGFRGLNTVCEEM